MNHIEPSPQSIHPFNPWGMGGLGLLLGSLATLLVLGFMEQIGPQPIEIYPPLPTSTPAPTATPSPLRVHINGQVNQPGVYEMPSGHIVQDLLAVAGGFTAEADGDLVNLAQPLRDGMHICVPSLDGEQRCPSAGVAEGTTAVSAAGGLIDINTATQTELETLPGIGPSTAQKIISYRQANGSFATIEEIMEVTGIGPAKFEGMREFIAAGSP